MKHYSKPMAFPCMSLKEFEELSVLDRKKKNKEKLSEIEEKRRTELKKRISMYKQVVINK